MNFLAHYIVAVRHLPPATPLPFYVCGNALPDILPLARPRRRLQTARLALPPASAEDAALQSGVLTHLATDSAFHKSEAFAQAQAEVNRLMADAGFTGMRVRAFFAGHVLTELALDAVLLRREPLLADAFYGTLGAADVQAVTCWAEDKAEGDIPALPAALSCFSGSPYLYSYKDDWGVAEGFNRLSGRAKQDMFQGDNWRLLLLVMARTMDIVERRAPAMLTQTLEALSPLLARS